ncbi:FAD synthetase family protein [Planococcus shenhongbingii]|uniref:FAD synthase n=1 Tax=Planococcus shenhongbingii TaxID=3058398 RepID=A0ABT8NEC0_9BACL|nr:FAD synthetase family protein [Planococcus sp. N017]MDN7246240.1 FAD synthetase family protein [Planococcus sp. N017]
MKTIYLNKENLSGWQKRASTNVMALGYFDGLHRGHCKVIETARSIAEEKGLPLMVMSFSPHPKTVLSNGKEQVHYLMPLSKKEERLRELGVDTFLIVEFDKEFAGLLPEQFVGKYLIGLGVVHAVAGFDFSYGSKGAGNMDRLKSDSAGRVETTKVAKVTYRNEKIGSTCIREKLFCGNVEELPHLLGHAYEVRCQWNGTCLETDPDYLLPAPGRYAVTLKNEWGSAFTELSVMEQAGGLSLSCGNLLKDFVEGPLTVIWHNRIVENAAVNV